MVMVEVSRLPAEVKGRAAPECEGLVFHATAVLVIGRLLIPLNRLSACAAVVASIDFALSHSVRFAAIGTREVARAGMNQALLGVVVMSVVHTFTWLVRFGCFAS